MEGNASFAHGFTFAGHPVAAAIAMANLDVYEREDLCGHVLAKEGEFRADAGDPARPADRRRRARRRLLPRDRAGQGQGDEGELRRRGVRAAAARLPLRRALQARADLPRRRPRRPGDPAGAAADRRHRAVRRDPRRPARGASRPRPWSASGRSVASGPPPDRGRAHRPEPARRARPRAGGRREGGRGAGPLGPHLRARGPDARGSPAAS